MSPYMNQFLIKFGLSSRHGFLSDQQPIRRLSAAYYEPWELVIRNLPELISDRLVRSTVDSMPILSTSELISEEEWRRAYSILSFMTHAYIWSGVKPSQILPASICCPYLEVAAHFDLPPTATYAALELWNWSPKSPGVELESPEDLQILHTFTGTPDEEWFYAISIAIELEGAKIMPAMLECFEAVRSDCHNEVVRRLAEIRDCILRLGQILDRMHERCRPQVFYHQIRPFLAGSKGMENAGLPKGVFYGTGDGRGSWCQYSGGSNAQSSLVQLLDAMLGVEHCATDKATSNSATKAKQGYIQEMRAYMPRQHRLFIQHIEQHSNIKAYAMAPNTNSAVHKSYVRALASLTTLRDKHMSLVARYIIAPSRQPPAAPDPKEEVNIATASLQRGDANQARLCGTGGTHLMPFLKQTRDETWQAGIMPDTEISADAAEPAEDTSSLPAWIRSSLPIIKTGTAMLLRVGVWGYSKQGSC